MRLPCTFRLLACLFIFNICACGGVATLPEQAGVGPNPMLPAPSPTLLPTVNIAPAKGWAAGETPKAAAGLPMGAFATGLDRPRWLYVLPNGDVLVAETNAPPRPEDRKGIKGWIMKLVMERAGASATPDLGSRRRFATTCWKRSSMSAKEYDLIVLGTGDAGQAVALAAAKEKWKVAIIEKKAVGGTCALWGCVPKKVLISGEELANFSQRMAAGGISSTTIPDWAELMAFKNRLTGSFSRDHRSSLQKHGIDIYEGAASFAGEAAIQVGEIMLHSPYFHIATGACPRPLGIPGEEFVTTSSEFLYLEALPPRLVFIGGGYISFEFAHLAARYGRDVTIIHRSAAVLKKFDPDLVALLVQASEKLGITVATDQPLVRVEKKKDEMLVIVETAGKEKEYHADMVVHGAGRVPDIADLNLKAAGIETSQDGVVVNEYLQSISNPRVYAAGDAAAGGMPLTPVAMLEGSVAADNLVHNLKRRRSDYRVVPTVVFTLPKLASVGLQEAEANAQGLQYDVKYRETADWLHNLRINEPFAGFKIVMERSTGRILGAHLLDSHADDLINLFALAMQHHLTAADIKQVLYAYPTASSSVQHMVG